jgi:hypothetical protein
MKDMTKKPGLMLALFGAMAASLFAQAGLQD